MNYSALRKTARFLLSILRFAAGHLFLAALVLILIALLSGLAVFYKYYISPQKSELILESEPIKFKEDIYQKILQEWQNRGERFETARTKEYLDPFKP